MRGRWRGSLLVGVLTVSLAAPGAAGASDAAEGSDDDVAWTRQFGQAGYDSARAVAVDDAGNVYVAGYLDGALADQANAGEIDSFVRAFDPDGGELWIRQFGTDGTDGAYGIAVDGSGVVYVVGGTSGAFPDHKNAGSFDVFVSAFSSDGEELWTRQFGTKKDDVAYGVAVDASGTVHVAGSTLGKLKGQARMGSEDAFVQSYDPEGQVLRTIQFGTTEGDGAYGIAVDDAGNIYVAGVTAGVFRGLSGKGLFDAFVRVFDVDGRELWTAQLGADEEVGAEAVAVGASGNVYLAVSTQTNLGAELADSYLARVDPGGDSWSSHLAGDGAYGVAVDGAENVFVVGLTKSTLPGQSSAGLDDAIIRAWDADWAFIADQQFGTPGSDVAYDVAVDSAGNVYVVGQVEGALPGQVAAGDADAFVRKYPGSAFEPAVLEATPEPTVDEPAIASPAAAETADRQGPEVDLIERYPMDIGASPIAEEDLVVLHGEEIADGIGWDPAALAELTGAVVEDMTVIMATHAFPDAEVFLAAVQVRGADPVTLTEAMTAWSLEGMDFPDYEVTEVAGREVTVFLTEETLVDANNRMYVSGDIAWLWTAPESYAEMVLEQLPE